MARSISFDINARDQASAQLLQVGRNVEQVERQIEALNRRSVEIDVDTASTERQLQVLREELRTATGDRRIEVEADISRAERELQRLRQTRIQVDVDTAAAEAQLAEIHRSVDRLDGREVNVQVDVDATRALGQIALVGVALGGLFPLIAATGVGLLGIGAAGAVGFGAIAGSLSGVGDAVTALGEKDTSVSSSMKSNASAVKSAIEGVSQAQRRVTDAEEQHTDAVRAAKRAQDDLNDARKQAAQQLDDLKRRTEEMAMDEVDAALRVREAQQRLNEVKADPKATSLERERAALSVAQAQARAKQLSEDGKRLKDEKSEADRKGIEGSDLVRDAQDRVAQANRNVQKSLQAIKDAQNDVVKAQERVREASQQAGTQGASSVNKLRDAMAGLTPEGRRFAVFLRGLLDGPIKDLRDAGQRNLLPGLQKGLESMLPFAGQITTSFGTIAKNLGDMFARLGPHIGPAVAQLARLAAVASNKVFKDLGDFIGFLLDKFTKWAQGQTTESITKSLDKFENILRKVWGGLRLVAQGFKWLIDHQGDMLLVSGAILAIRGALIGVQAVMTLGPWGLLAVAIVGLGVGLVLLYKHSEGFREAVNRLWEKLKDGFKVVADILLPKLKELWKTIKEELWPAFQGLIVALQPVIDFMIQTMWPIFARIWGIIIDVVRGAIKIIAGIINIVTGIISGDWSKVWTGIKQVFSGIWTAIKGILSGAWEIIKQIFGGAFNWVKDKTSDAWNWVKKKISDVWEGIKGLLKRGWDWIKDNVFAKVESGAKSLGKAFETAKDLIGKAWDKVKETAAKPIRFVIDTVIGGVASKFNSIAEKVGVGLRLPVLKAGFARGGPITGPGGGTDDQVPIMGSAGEWVIRAAAAQRLGARTMHLINHADKYDISGDPSRGLVRPRFASGGEITPEIAGRVGPVRSWIPSVDPLPYVWGGVGPSGYDCSGLVGEVWARLTGRQSYRRYMTTNTILDAPGSLGLAPGPGLFTIGVSRTHTAGNLAGLAFEAASSRSGIKIGGAAKSVTSFPSMFHLANLGTAGFSNDGGGGFSWNPLDWAKSLASKAIGAVSNAWWGTLDGMGIFGQMGAGLGKKLISSIFDTGGMLQPGYTLAYNGTGRPERVLSAGETDRYAAQVNSRAVGASSGVTYNITVPISNAVIGNEQQTSKYVISAINSAVRSGTLRLPSK